MTRVWIVEMLIDTKWEPTAGSATCRGGGRVELRRWQNRNPDDTFRLTKYLPAPPQPAGEGGES